MLNLQHNIVSILYTIKGMIGSYLAQAQEGRFGQNTERLRHAEAVLKRAWAQSDQALEITRRLGRRLKTGQDLKKPRMKVGVKRAWRRVLKLLAGEFSLDRIEILERIPERFPLIRCDRDEFQEILYHLAKNALQAMNTLSAGPGRLIIRAQIAFTSKEESFALLQVSDTGAGIAEDKLPYLFHPFFTTKTEGEGTGLGLYLTRDLVLQNGGRITAASFRGFGTTVTLEFPLSKEAKPPVMSKPSD